MRKVRLGEKSHLRHDLHQAKQHSLELNGGTESAYATDVAAMSFGVDYQIPTPAGLPGGVAPVVCNLSPCVLGDKCCAVGFLAQCPVL